MLRALAASATVLAVLMGLALAPHSHVHPAGTRVGDDHHHRPGRGVVKHAHLSAHLPAAHEPAALDHDKGDAHHEHDRPQVVSAADEFVFRIADGPRGPAAADLAPADTVVPPAPSAMAAPALQPPAHGPPEGRSAPSRAPPSDPAAAA